MSKYIFFLINLLSIILISGCLTTSSMVRTLEQNPNLTPSEADQKFGKPYQEKNNPQKNLVLKIYAPAFTDFEDYVAVVFVNNKLFRYGKNDAFFHLGVGKDLGLISEDEYRWNMEQYMKMHLAHTQMQYQMLRDWQNTQYQNQVLSNQRKLIELEKQKVNSIQYKQPQIIGRQSTTDCYTDSQGNIHCTTNQH